MQSLNTDFKFKHHSVMPVTLLAQLIKRCWPELTSLNLPLKTLHVLQISIFYICNRLSKDR